MHRLPVQGETKKRPGNWAPGRFGLNGRAARYESAAITSASGLVAKYELG